MTANLPVSKADLLTGLQAMATAPAASGGDKPFLRLARHGAWIYGSDAIEVPTASLWAVNPMSAQKGYIAWGDAEVLGEQMVPFSHPDIDPNNLPSVGGQWQYQLGVDLVCVDGPDKGITVSYNTTSHGGKKAMTNLLRDIVAQLSAGSDEYVPLVHLKVDSYKHKKYGTVFNPVFEVARWNTIDSTEVPDEDADEAPPPPTEQPRARTRLR